MELYVTSHNTGPSYGGDPKFMRYIGISIQDAINAVPENFQKYINNDFLTGRMYPEIYTTLPKDTNYEYVHFYMADGWWYSIVKTVFEE